MCSIQCEVYIRNVTQCNKCYKFGHVAKFCKSQEKCINCGEHPKHDKCTKEKKCVNCYQQHLAIYKGCAERQRQKEIAEIMAYRNLTYSEASAEIPKINSNILFSHQIGNRFQILDLDDDQNFPSFNAYSYNQTEKPIPVLNTLPPRTQQNPFKTPYPKNQKSTKPQTSISRSSTFSKRKLEEQDFHEDQTPSKKQVIPGLEPERIEHLKTALKEAVENTKINHLQMEKPKTDDQMSTSSNSTENSNCSGKSKRGRKPRGTTHTNR